MFLQWFNSIHSLLYLIAQPLTLMKIYLWKSNYTVALTVNNKILDKLFVANNLGKCKRGWGASRLIRQFQFLIPCHQCYSNCFQKTSDMLCSMTCWLYCYSKLLSPMLTLRKRNHQAKPTKQKKLKKPQTNKIKPPTTKNPNQSCYLLL